MKKLILLATALLLTACGSKESPSNHGITPNTVDNNEVYVYKDGETGCEYLLFKGDRLGGIIPRLDKCQSVKGCGEANTNE